MIKFFQKLKAKKGFTLVELIVVIAIIGVLAAILIPTMLGYVTQSRVTSVNSTAASIKNNIDTFLTNCDTAGYGMLKSNTAYSKFEIKISGGTWTVSGLTTAAFKNGNGKTWSASNNGSAKESKGSVGDPAKLMMIELADLFPEVKSGSIGGSLLGGKCVCLYYTADTENAGSDAAQIDGEISSTGWRTATCAWDGSTAGVSSEGYIIGTAPVLTL